MARGSRPRRAGLGSRQPGSPWPPGSPDRERRGRVIASLPGQAKELVRFRACRRSRPETQVRSKGITLAGTLLILGLTVLAFAGGRLFGRVEEPTTVAHARRWSSASFPSLLLATTLCRLVLNVATTRLILTRAGTDGLQAAGGVVKSFGEFVAGDKIVVGLIIFVIIVVIQFVVITKGATRISEVAARFALDGMPGRQMAIDADLNAGIIDEREAQRRRAGDHAAGRLLRGDGRCQQVRPRRRHRRHRHHAHQHRRRACSSAWSRRA